ncbi:DUF3576 domain-containing protein [Candidatus Viadribacter manganicus]|uniref:DUF3576 domain-containing protein n=1 Tax=Candidatus Viadribacter manganicus TaxID=1759059 RepID=A0A1B1AIC4_9PROT|nr:DUF3576 domain-containing protein [Candidatus Viadribacter manganicus]ANP46314.1 hypothetical protein ATE48_10495 [Candidatus Viadribacter manganicus]
MMQAGRTLLKGAIFMVAAVALSGCSMFRADDSGQSRADDNAGRSSNSGGGGIFGVGGGGRASEDGIGVNSYLWRASLDTLNFMPLGSADPFGGVIITDWYSAPTTPNERFKATVYILDTRLRADALNVSIFRQTNTNGQWSDASVDPDTEIQIENAILQRARELRLSNVR